MNPEVHKSERRIRTKTVRFYLFVSTGHDPRKGWRIPLNEIKYNEQRDEETGYGYLPRQARQAYHGARYMDHELMTMWLSVDPLADKYPSISPYAYCAWNPVKLVDPDGRDWVVIFDHENKTVTIEAKYATNSDDAKSSAEKAVRPWNDLSGKYSLMVGKEKYAVYFNLSVIDEDEYNEDDESHNTYSLAPHLYSKDGEIDNNIKGQTNIREINILESEKDNFITSSHEIGHSLGLLHPISNNIKGLMEKDGGRKSNHHEITKANIESILRLALHPPKPDPDYPRGHGSYREIGGPNADIKNPLKLRLLTN